MRVTVILLALASLTACDRNASESDQPDAPVVPAEITYEGADAGDAVARVKHGERLASAIGCKACHGENLQGTNVTALEPDQGDMNAPNLTLLIAKYTDAELDRLIRHGVPRDGREFWFMPSETYQYLSDADFTALVAYLRTLKPAGEQLPPIRMGPKFLEDVKKGYTTNASKTVARFRTSQPPDLGESHAFGRYVAMTSCTMCHNSELQGYEGFTPDLDIAGAYSAEELEVLLTTGKGKSKPDLGLMAVIAKSSLSQMTPRERAAVIAYVKARADRPQ